MKYCDKYVMFDSLSVCSHISETISPNFAKLSMHLGCGLVLRRRRCNMFCTYGFVDNIMFSHSRPYGTLGVFLRCDRMA